ncbi:MAG TPA: protein-disulfide reductase DsbD domain-containing protein, partial [Verrucomicrobiae bacterium]|nr:protein-disulfide reductase DsbD domain-containing protein [Verrucomicrobiae bacterium]
MRVILNILTAALLTIAATAQAAHTEAKLLLADAVAKPGDTVLAGIHLQMEPDWHTYWKNSGASGIATSIEWELPAGVTAGDIQWPVPEKLPPDELTTYIYQHEVILIVPLKLAPDLKPGSYTIKANPSWLECKEQCIPGSAQVQATLVVGNETQPSTDAPAIQHWRDRVPKSGEALHARAWWEKNVSEDLRSLILEWDSPRDASAADFYPFGSADFEVQGATERIPADAGKIRLRKFVKKFEGDWPKEIGGILIGNTSERGNAFETKIQIAQGAPADVNATVPRSPFSWLKLFSSLSFAFLGGLILNIMPCVLPVIALKIFSFVKQSGESPKRARRLAVIYALGIVCSFLILAGFLIAAQKAGETASWGMQMQNRNFVLGMTILVLLVTLNLFGLFEVTLSGKALNATGNLTNRTGAPGAFFNGVLATALAIPCTAPFLVTALAFAFAQPPGIVLLVFTFIALGLASPYLVLTWNPNLMKFLPKPGPWMNQFKVALGFVMLITVVWLYKLSLNHLSKNQGLWFGIFLATMACAAWIWGEFVQRGTRRKALSAVIALFLVVSVGAYGATRREGIKWQPWSAAAVESARKGGHPVLVDFTADWCLTCQLNLRTSIDIPKVHEKLAETGTTTLIADYTVKNEQIGAEIHRLGRDAVPLVVVFPRDPKADPIV